MAALVAGVQYGLSSQSHFYENKSLIFVKLTDSAQRAIEDFLKNRNKTNQRPTIQFLDNEGRLSFPSPQSNHGSVDFTFSLSDGHDVEGPQGAFECIQQTNPNNLESLGTMPYKMRIHANEDVYETTRHRMAVAEENNKNKCTRVIKPNGPDIGRKVKVKATGKTIPPPSNVRHNNHHRDTSIPNSTSRPVKNSIINSLSSATLSSQQPSTTTSSSSSSSSSPSFLSATLTTTTTTSSSTLSTLSSSPSLPSRFYKLSATSNTSSVRSQPDKKLSDLQRRPLRDRLIHILALRPYKKPELYERLNREGLKERDKKEMAILLRSLASMRNNTYHLVRHVWNEVQEDWPFYSEQDRAMLKRRKPQNLTPPGSSDGGSSGSGQSPNSTHPGSPPAITAPPSNFMNCKRPGYYQGSDGIQTKRPRISHYRKPEPTTRTPSSTNSNTANVNIASNVSVNVPNGSNLPNNNNNNNNINNDVNNWNEQRQQSSERDINYHRSERTSNSDVLRGNNNVYQLNNSTSNNNNNNNINNNNNNNHNNNSKSCFTPNRDRDRDRERDRDRDRERERDDLNSNSNRTASIATTSSTLSPTIINNSSATDRNDAGSNSGNISDYSNRDRERRDRDKDREKEKEKEREKEREREEVRRDKEKEKGKEEEIEKERERERVEKVERIERVNSNKQEREKKIKENSDNWNGIASNSNINASTARGATGGIVKNHEINENNADNEIPDYLTQYKTVRNMEERRRYKADYLAGKEEYEEIYHRKLIRARHFVRLRDLRKRELELGNYERYEALCTQIKADYDAIKYDPREIENEERYLYLYNKLNYIKGLIDEYDRKYSSDIDNQTSITHTNTNNNNNNNNNDNNNNSNNNSETSVSITELRY
ncbi:RNA polymerase II elongation factor Ell-like isoform X2 [Microplitis mediator]|uniref:RNA polymerase II elongation factor Ell-like isoform X2 n=1 Tax=Microplitis mediator TaxID=375433 RepID=UPI0025576AE8|nr:RNA polymerase II elongation factor Ell-like isoform X2 [Microplitis mediator]